MGDTSTQPANTLAAFDDAVTSGADMVEMDVSVTADGVAICTHGPRLETWTNGSGKVHQVAWSAVGGLQARVWRDGAVSSQQVPVLSEALACVDGRMPINLDIKRYRALQPAVAALGTDREFGVISGLTPGQARRALRRYPGLPILVNLNPFDKALAAWGPWRARWLTRRSMRRLYKRPEVVALNLNLAWVDQALVRSVHHLGAQVWVYTAADQSEVDAALAVGADSITVDSPRTLRLPGGAAPIL